MASSSSSSSSSLKRIQRSTTTIETDPRQLHDVDDEKAPKKLRLLSSESSVETPAPSLLPLSRYQVNPFQLVPNHLFIILGIHIFHHLFARLVAAWLLIRVSSLNSA